jgi:hypothetical protein
MLNHCHTDLSLPLAPCLPPLRLLSDSYETLSPTLAQYPLSLNLLRYSQQKHQLHFLPTVYTRLHSTTY